MRILQGEVLGITDPRFNLREICKQLLLLEDHLYSPNKQCPDCITKHFLTTEALVEEMNSLMGQDHPGVAFFASWVRGLFDGYRNGIPPRVIAGTIRPVRKRMCRQLFGY